MIRNPFRKRWVVVIVGQYSGRRTPITFAAYWRRRSAEAFAARGNERRLVGTSRELDTTRYDVERLP